MSAMTDFLANKIRDHVLRNTAYTSPTTVYLAAYTTPTTEAGGGTEVVGGSYARLAITFNAGSAGLAEQASNLSFTGMPACTVSHIAILDDPTAGNMLLHSALPAKVVVTAGGTLAWSASNIKFLFD
jgi:hypothetical protein